MKTLQNISREISAPQENSKLICFVCTGNTCRSPMAAAVFNRLAQNTPYRAISRAIMPGGEKISDFAVTALKKRGFISSDDTGLMNHVSRQITPEDTEKSSLIVGVTSRHRMNLIFRFPDCADKITALGSDIPDPYGKDLAEYENCLAAIETEVRALAEDIGMTLQ